MKKGISYLLCILLLAGVAAAFTGCTPTVLEIEIDGGGDTGHFNTTPSMTQSEVNPFPYNTLEVLLKEWEEKNPKYKVKLRRTSYGGDQASLIPLLKSKKAPDLIYQNGSVKESHIGNNYYVPYNDYLDKPNPYNDNKPWKDVYVDAELAGTMASDGNYYYMNLERLAAGILYNKTFFDAHDIEVPETFAGFMAAQDKIAAQGKFPYIAQYPWYNIVLETNIFSALIPELDTIRHNGVIDMEEMIRGYVKGYWTPDSPEYRRYIELICEKAKYEPKGGVGFAAIDSFIRQDTIMIESTSTAMRHANYNTTKGFEVGVFGYPYLTEAELAVPGAVPGPHCYRGTAGTATSWWVTKAAEEKGTVDAVMDIMMFLTSPENNNRLIGDMEGAIPLDPQVEVADYLQPLVDMYNEDFTATGDEKCVGWGSLSSWGSLGLEYNSFFLQAINNLLAKKDANGIVAKADQEKTVQDIIEYTETKINSLRIENVYDEASW